MHKIPMGRIAFFEVVWLLKLAVLTTLAACVLVAFGGLLLAIIKDVFEPVIGKKAVPVVLFLMNLLVLLKIYVHRFSRDRRIR